MCTVFNLNNYIGQVYQFVSLLYLINYYKSDRREKKIITLTIMINTYIIFEDKQFLVSFSIYLNFNNWLNVKWSHTLRQKCSKINSNASKFNEFA